MFPLRDENPSSRTPVVSRALIAVCVATYLYERALGPGLAPFLREWGMVPARLVLSTAGDGSFPAQAATVFTSMFLHADWLHLLGNMWYLWIFGDNVEDRLGHSRFLVFYLAAGVFAALVHAVAMASSTVPTVGASGAIAGVLGAYALLFPRARVMTVVPILVVVQVVAVPALVLLGLWFVFQFVSGALVDTHATGGVAWWAHVAGFAFGIAVTALGWRSRPSDGLEREPRSP